jgi:hypothetical protein
LIRKKKENSLLLRGETLRSPYPTYGKAKASNWFICPLIISPPSKSFTVILNGSLSGEGSLRVDKLLLPSPEQMAR